MLGHFFQRLTVIGEGVLTGANIFAGWFVRFVAAVALGAQLLACRYVLALMTAVLTTGCAITDTYNALQFSTNPRAFTKAMSAASAKTPAPFEHESPTLKSYYQPVTQASGVNLQGPLDTSFNSSGMSTVPFRNNAVIARAVAIQADGKIVTVGNAHSAKNGNSFLALARLNKDGRPDVTFGRFGQVTTIGLVGFAVAIQTDGKIVVSGTGYSFKSKSAEIELIRYNIDGSLDTGFGAGGVATKNIATTLGFGTTSLAIQADGKIVVLGNEAVYGKIGDSAFTLLRFNKNGSLDSTFGENGKASTSFSRTANIASAVAIQADGKIVAVGSSLRRQPGAREIIGTHFDFSLARYNTNGSLDATFGVGGRITTDAGGPEMANAVAIQADGKIVVAGSAREVLAEGEMRRTGGIGLVRYNPNGSIDPTFAAGGMVKTLDETFRTVNGAVSGREREAQAVAIQPNGKIVVVTGKDFSVLRYTTDGHLDTGFAASGEARVQMGRNVLVGHALAIQADGKIVAVGSSDDRSQYSDDTNDGFAIVRYLP